MRYLQAETCLIFFSPCACQSLLESRRRLSSTTPRHPVFLQLCCNSPSATRVPEGPAGVSSPWPPVCCPFPQPALDFPGDLCCPPAHLCWNLPRAQRDLPHPWLGYLPGRNTFIIPQQRLAPPKCCRKPSSFHFCTFLLLSLPSQGQFFCSCVFQVLENSHQCCR